MKYVYRAATVVAMKTRRGRPRDKLDFVTNTLRGRIESGAWQPGEALPGELELARELSVARMTLRGALSELARLGLIERVRGRGTFVKRAADAPRTSTTLAIIVQRSDEPLDADSYTSQLGLGMQRALQDSGFVSSIHTVPAGERVIDFVRANPQVAATWGGVLTHAHLLDGPSRDWFDATHIPVVCITTPDPAVRISYVDLDNVAGGRMAMRHLLERGATRPAIMDSLGSKSHSAARARGYRAALAEFGVEIPERNLLRHRNRTTRESQDTAAKLLAPLLKGKDAIDSVIVYGEHPTIGVYRAVEDAELAVGRDVAVVHYNDYPWLREVLSPTPTAVRQPFDRVACEATLMLQRKIRRTDRKRERKIIKPELVIRESSFPKP